MRDGRSALTGWAVAGACVVTALSLLAPWARSGSADKTSVDLLRSASALDLFTGPAKVAVVVAWYSIALLAAAAVVAAAWDRLRFTAAVAVPMGPLMALALWAVTASPLDLRWGAWLGVGAGLTASGLAALVLLVGIPSAEGTA